MRSLRSCGLVAGAGVATTAAALALAPSAFAATITSGHYDLVSTVNCSAHTISLAVDNHGGSGGLSDTFKAANNSASATATDKRNVGTSAPRFISGAASSSLIVGFDVDYVGGNSSCGPLVVTAVTSATSPRIVGYEEGTSNLPLIDTAGTNNSGWEVDSHEDPRWDIGTATAGRTFTLHFAVTGASTNQNVTFAAS